jgi:hypothetical protein
MKSLHIGSSTFNLKCHNSMTVLLWSPTDVPDACIRYASHKEHVGFKVASGGRSPSFLSRLWLLKPESNLNLKWSEVASPNTLAKAVLCIESRASIWARVHHPNPKEWRGVDAPTFSRSI